MPRGGLQKATLVKVAHHDYWERVVSKASRAAVSMQEALKLLRNQSSAEELPTAHKHLPTTHHMKSYYSCRLSPLHSCPTGESLNHHNDEQSQRGRHLSVMLTWSVVGWSLFTGFQSTSTSLPTPSINVPLLELVLKDSSNDQIQNAPAIMGDLIAKGIVKNTKPHIQEQVPSSFDTKDHCIIDVGVAFFAISAVSLCSLIPSRGPGSSEDVVFNNLEQQFPFFIVEFEANEFTIHKDEMVFVAETVFEYNKFLATTPYMTEAEVNRICLHIGLINGITIQLGLIKALYNEADRILLYTYYAQNAIFKLHTGNQEVDIINAFKFMMSLKKFVYQDGMTLKALLNREETRQNRDLLADLAKELFLGIVGVDVSEVARTGTTILNNDDENSRLLIPNNDNDN
ncbi:hypothetical protein G9A89_003536 [Geosiphon pyriformis]|nr:hypothetical protein G9A89_003536 [Geosiphon pyriformis]